MRGEATANGSPNFLPHHPYYWVEAMMIRGDKQGH